MDIEVFWDDVGHRGDIKVANGDLVMGNDIRTAVIISLFTDRRAEDDDELPDAMASKRGWWADGLDAIGSGRRIGSRLWLLGREKQMSEVLARAREYVEESLQWLIDDGVATAVKATATSNGKGMLSIAIAITKPNSTRDLGFRFGFAWTQTNQGNS